jgi:hypothetical protein
LKTLSWCVAGLAALIAAYSLFAWWATNAESFGRRDAGLALFFAFSSGYALMACLWLAPASAAVALAAWLTKKGSALALLLAAAVSALPFVLLR